jgi:alpha-L-fucosidase
LQPGIIINNRLDLGPGCNDNQILSPDADFYTPEQRIGHYDTQRPWETCMTLGTQWTWKPDDAIKSAKEVLAILARSAGGDGNLLLNVGPMPDGRIEPRQAEVLASVGAWLKRNGRSIYGTRGGPFKPGGYGASTRRDRSVFVHVLDWSTDPLRLPPIPATIVRGRVLRRGKVVVRQTEAGIELSVPAAERDSADTVIELKLDRDALQIPAAEAPAG